MPKLRLNSESLEFDVTITPTQLRTLFDESLEDIIKNSVDVDKIISDLKNDNTFIKEVTEDIIFKVQDNIDYDDIAERVSRGDILSDLIDEIDLDVLATKIPARKIANIIDASLIVITNSEEFNNKITKVIEDKMTNVENQIIERVLKGIAIRLQGGADV
jgi:membrane-bound lytic murein transglycosylase MltF